MTSRPSTSMVFRWFSDFLGRWLTMVLKFQGYKKCVNSTRDKMCFRNAGERITALNSFRRAESYERGTDRDLIFLEIGIQSKRNPGRPKQRPNNAHLVEYSNMGPRFCTTVRFLKTFSVNYTVRRTDRFHRFLLQRKLFVKGIIIN